MREIYRATSQNGHWGMALVSNGIEERLCRETPVQANVIKLGEAEGHEVFRLEPTSALQWAAVFGDAEVISGASMVYGCSLQGNSNVSLILLSEQALVRVYGYKRRSERIIYFEQGEVRRVPSSVLLALGLLGNNAEPQLVASPPAFNLGAMAPETKSALADALRKAGLA